MKIFIETSNADYNDFFDVSFEGMDMFATYTSHKENPYDFFVDMDIWNRLVVRFKEDGRCVNDDLGHGHHNLEDAYDAFVETYYQYRDQIDDVITLMIREGLGDTELEV